MAVYVRLPNGNLMTRKEHKQREQDLVGTPSIEAAPVVLTATKPEPKVTSLETKDDNKV